MQGHPPLDAPLDRRRLVVGEVHTRAGAHEAEDGHQTVIGHRRLGTGEVHIGVFADMRQLLGNGRWRHDEIHAPRGYGIAGHTGVFGRFLVLGKRDAARDLDRLYAHGAVTGRSG